MRKTKLTLASILVAAGTLGAAFAIFVFDTTRTATNDGITVDLEGYADVGTLALSDPNPTTWKFDNAAGMQAVTIKAKHTAPATGTLPPLGTASGEYKVSRSVTAKFNDATLDTYVSWAATGTWLATDATTDDLTLATITLTPTWKAGMEPTGSTGVTQWETLDAAIDAVSGGAKIVVTATVTYTVNS